MARAYEKSHPWLKFSLGLSGDLKDLWLLLGEARSKCEHLRGVPLEPEVAKKLHLVYLAKGVHATTAIEGNTLSEEEVLKIVEGKFKSQKSTAYLRQEVENVAKAANAILTSVEKSDAEILTVEQIKLYNRQVLEGLSVDEHVVPGEYSKVQVGVPRYRGASVQDFNYLMNRFTEWLNSSDFEAPSDEWIVPFGVLKSIIAHIYLVWIHPFGDGNGRTARLLEVRFLLEANVPSSAAHLLSNHYNRTREEYYRQLDFASKSGGDLIPFIRYAVQGFVDEMRNQLVVVKQHIWDVSWKSFVYARFGRDPTVAERRQLRLVLDLGKMEEAMPRSRIRLLTPELAAEYATKTSKTVSRDLSRLKSLDLIAEDKTGVRARKELLLAFLPRSRPGNAERQLSEALRIRRSSEQLELF